MLDASCGDTCRGGGPSIAIAAPTATPVVTVAAAASETTTRPPSSVGVDVTATAVTTMAANVANDNARYNPAVDVNGGPSPAALVDDADAGNARRRRLATSTAMEPEIGFLMANLALAGVVVRGRRRARVLDPCCGGGRLPLYAAASGATGPLIGVDSDLDVWDSAEWEERHRRRGGRRREIVAAAGGGTDVRGRGRLESLVDGRVVHPQLVRCYNMRSSLQHRRSGPRGWAGFAA